MVYLVARFSLSPVELGYLLGAYGLATMLSEGKAATNATNKNAPTPNSNFRLCCIP